MLVELGDMVQKHNYFQFFDKTFRRKQDTAIGIKFAPPYSIFFMTDLEKCLLSDIDLKPYICWRYVDDVFLIQEHGEESLKLILEEINSIHPTRFTLDWSYNSVSFRDVKNILKDGKIITYFYVKLADTHQQLDSSICHQYYWKKSIRYSQALHLNRICYNNAVFDNIFLIWEHGEESLKLFLEKINNIHSTIKFTADWSYSSVNFLDVKIILKDGNIITDFYAKPANTHQYLGSSSCHQYHCK